MERRSWLVLGSVLALVVLASGSGVNQSIRVADGEFRDGELSTVNGGITIGDGATVEGTCHSVNGGITVGANARVEALDSVNGPVRVGDGTIVEKDVESVNGPVTLDRGAQANGVSTINGPIRLTRADVFRDVTTINGDFSLLDGTNVGGNVIVEEANGNNSPRKRALEIELTGGSVIEGDVIVEDPDYPVKVYLRDGSRIMGQVKGAELIKG